MTLLLTTAENLAFLAKLRAKSKLDFEKLYNSNDCSRRLCIASNSEGNCWKTYHLSMHVAHLPAQPKVNRHLVKSCCAVPRVHCPKWGRHALYLAAFHHWNSIRAANGKLVLQSASRANSYFARSILIHRVADLPGILAINYYYCLETEWMLINSWESSVHNRFITSKWWKCPMPSDGYANSTTACAINLWTAKCSIPRICSKLNGIVWRSITMAIPKYH